MFSLPVAYHNISQSGSYFVELFSSSTESTSMYSKAKFFRKLIGAQKSKNLKPSAAMYAKYMAALRERSLSELPLKGRVLPCYPGLVKQQMEFILWRCRAEISNPALSQIGKRALIYAEFERQNSFQ